MAAASSTCFCFCLIFSLFFLISSIPFKPVDARRVSSLISRELFNKFFLHKDNNACPAKDFYTYESFIQATKSFRRFGNTGRLTIRKREIAAFLAQISHETTGGWATAPDGPFAWGLCFKEEVSPQSNYCDSTNKEWPCVAGKSYKGRGPIQLSWNYNYGPAGKALGFDGLGNPEAVTNNSLIAFKTGLWFWMTEQKPKPSCHKVMVGRYRLTRSDKQANRTVGFGLVTNIINGGLECGKGDNAAVKDRIGYFQRYVELFNSEPKKFVRLFNVTTGPNLDCGTQKSF